MIKERALTTRLIKEGILPAAIHSKFHLPIANTGGEPKE
jgi:hypothetical protein